MKAHVAFLNNMTPPATSSCPAERFHGTAASSSPSVRAGDAIEALVREDPFVARGLAEFRVIEFRASQRAKAHGTTCSTSLLVAAIRHPPPSAAIRRKVSAIGAVMISRPA